VWAAEERSLSVVTPPAPAPTHSVTDSGRQRQGDGEEMASA
jgi:hypothetical protein